MTRPITRVCVTKTNGQKEVRHTFFVDANRLPQQFNAEGLVVTVKSEAAKAKKSRPSNGRSLQHQLTKIKKPVDVPVGTKFEIELPAAVRSKSGKPTWQVYGVITIPVELRTMLPPFAEQWYFKTARIEVPVSMKCAHDSEKYLYRGSNISGLTEVMKAHPDWAPGDVLVFKKLNPVNVDGVEYQRYSVSVKK